MRLIGMALSSLHPYRLHNDEHSRKEERHIHIFTSKYASKDILNVFTKVHFVQFATFQQPEYKRQILG